MKIDLTDNQYLLYISDRDDNKVVVRYSENHKFKTSNVMKLEKKF